MIKLKNRETNNFIASQTSFASPKNDRLNRGKGLFHKILESQNEPHLITRIYSFLPQASQAATIVTLQDMKVYAKMMSLTKELHLFDFREGNVEPRAILTKCPNLKRLDLSNCVNTFKEQDGLDYLAQLKQLTHLDLSFSFQIASQIKNLELPELTHLNLTGWMKLTDADIETLVEYPKLSEVVITHCDLITQVGIENVQKLRAQKNFPPIIFTGRGNQTV